MGLKKILLINWRDNHNPEAGGAEVYYHEIFKRIARQGRYAITVLTHAYPGAPAEEDMDGLRVVRRGSRLLFNYAVIPFVRRRAASFDLIIEDINKIPFFTPLYCKKPRLHLVMHFFGKAIFRELSFPMALYVYAAERLVPGVYRRERFVAISKSTRDEIVAFTRDESRVRVVEPGIDTERYAPGPKASPPFLLYLGRLKRYKNVDFLIQCFPQLLSRFPDLRLEIGGTGDDGKRLSAMITGLNLKESVHLLGFIPEAEKKRLLQSAALFVNPSAKEGWGITSIEAALSGTASVASRVPGLQDSVVHDRTGLLFKYGDRNDFIGQVSALLSDPQRRRRMEEEAVAFAGKFSWDSMAEKMAAVLDGVL